MSTHEAMATWARGSATLQRALQGNFNCICTGHNHAGRNYTARNYIRHYCVDHGYIIQQVTG